MIHSDLPLQQVTQMVQITKLTLSRIICNHIDFCDQVTAHPIDDFDVKFGERWVRAEAGVMSPQVEEGEIT